MDAWSRLQLLVSQMHLEPSEDADCPRLGQKKQNAIFVSEAIQSNGGKIKLLKTLLTSVCERNCYYCPFRADQDCRRASFTPDEFAGLFINLYNQKIVEGLFLSSGIVNGGIFTQDKIIATAEILRKKYRFNGYIHIKIMPGAEKAQVEEAMLLANRVSINLEAPNTERLIQLAPHKNFTEELLQPLRWINEIRQTTPRFLAWNRYWPSSVTQFVVGATGDTDLELLSTSQILYRQLNLKRTYFSAFTPIKGTPLENHPPTPPLREYRLYEASFLIRDYDFTIKDITFDQSGNLPLDVDPKLLWAQNNITDPIEINQADLMQLLKIPGIGKKGATSIITRRRDHTICSTSELRSMGINVVRAKPFILLNGKLPVHQLSFSFNS